MGDGQDRLVVNAKVEMTAAALQTIVANAKRLTEPDGKGHYRVDTADLVGEMISRFLSEKDFEAWVNSIEHYPASG